MIGSRRSEAHLSDVLPCSKSRRTWRHQCQIQYQRRKLQRRLFRRIRLGNEVEFRRATSCKCLTVSSEEGVVDRSRELKTVKSTCSHSKDKGLLLTDIAVVECSQVMVFGNVECSSCRRRCFRRLPYAAIGV